MSQDVAWQFLIKKEKEVIENGFVPKFLPNDILIRRLSYQEASVFISEYEWVGNMGTSKYCFGLFLSSHLAGVVCYGPSVAPSYYRNLVGVEISKKLLQLCRGANTHWAPKWVPSKLISHTLKIINKELGTRAVIAYADPIAGEIGTIYQACNAVYIGKTSPGGGKKYIINGHLYDPRKVYSKFGSRARDYLLKLDPNFKTQPINPKHRYLFILGNNAQRKENLELIKDKILPFPKRVISISSE